VTTAVVPFSPRLVRQSAALGIDAVAQKVDENLLELKKHSGNLTETINRVTKILNIGGSGAPSSGGQTFDLGDVVYETTGAAEQWRAERTCDFTAATSPNLGIVFAGLAAVTGGGPGIFRVRAGGTPHAADGTEIARITVFASGFALVTYRSTAPNPGAVALLKLTGQAIAGQTASIKGVSITVR
jgi:hypothetical protein